MAQHAPLGSLEIGTSTTTGGFTSASVRLPRSPRRLCARQAEPHKWRICYLEGSELVAKLAQETFARAHAACQRNAARRRNGATVTPQPTARRFASITAPASTPASIEMQLRPLSRKVKHCDVRVERA